MAAKPGFCPFENEKARRMFAAEVADEFYKRLLNFGHPPDNQHVLVEAVIRFLEFRDKTQAIAAEVVKELESASVAREKEGAE